MAITIPNTFVAGTKIEAAPMNANFAETANAVDKRGDTLTGNLSANAGITVDGVDVSTIPNTAGTFNPLFAQVVIGSADTNGIRLDLESGALAVREGDDSAYGPLNTGALTVTGAALPATNDGGALGSGAASWSDLFLASGGVINLANGDVTLTHSSNTLSFAGAATGYVFADGPITNALGAVGTPSYTFTGDLNTGIWSPGADLLAISTGGTERYRVGAAGQLLVAGSAGTSGYVLTSGGSGAAPSWAAVSASPAVLSKTANYTVQTSDGADVVVLCTNTITITLYAASGNTGKIVTVKNNGTGTITIDGDGSETIDGSLTKTITAQYTSLSLVCDGTGWAII